MERQSRLTGMMVETLGLAVGVGIGYIDSRPGWDDAGITVGMLMLTAGLVGLMRPRAWWRVGLLVGLPVPLFNYLRTGSLQSSVAIVFAIVAAGIGGRLGCARERRSAQ